MQAINLLKYGWIPAEQQPRTAAESRRIFGFWKRTAADIEEIWGYSMSLWGERGIPPRLRYSTTEYAMRSDRPDTASDDGSETSRRVGIDVQ